MPVASASIRVRQLDLRAPGRDDVSPFRNDLEDALRTATLPLLPTGATLHIRKLSLGHLPRGLSRQALATLLADRIAQTPVEVLSWPHSPPPSDVSAAVIPDPVTGAALALDALLRGRPIHWALLAGYPAFQTGDTAASVTLVVDRLTEVAGPAALGRMMQLAGGTDLVRHVLEAVPQSAISRWMIPVVAALPGEILLQFNDLRSNGELRDRVQITQSALGQSGAARDEDGFEDAAPLLRDALDVATRRWRRHASETVLMVAWASAAQSGPWVLTGVLRRLLGPAEGLGNGKPRRSVKPNAPESDTRALARTARSEPVAQLEDWPAAADMGRAAQTVASLDSLADRPAIGGFESLFAGLFYLIAVMRHVNVDAADQALQAPVAQTVFRTFAARLGMPETAPVPAILEDAFPVEFTPLSGLWQPTGAALRLLAGRGGIGVSRSFPGRAALSLRHGPRGFGQVSATGLKQMQKENIPLWRQGPTKPLRDHEIVSSLTFATQRLATLLTGRGWRQLSLRPGKVLITPTHVDVTFDGRHVDPAVRRAGLDIDPGWVGWLGRVVSFHYDYAQVRDFPVAEDGS